jgi:hypothetical protein
MAVIINELEIELEPQAGGPQPAAQMPVPEKPPFGPQDLSALLDREQRNRLRVMAH